MSQSIPVIDIFAGPGGLGEGFSHSTGPLKFDVRLSCEVDTVACRTLRLRKFFLLSEGTAARQAYYDALKLKDPDKVLAAQFPALWEKAAARVLQARLGDDETRLEVHRRISQARNRSQEFVLIGGPPCQAYSLVGRSRRLGVGMPKTESESEYAELRRQRERVFYSDDRHHLYREYLEILAVHRPAVFVMENVKGLTSAKSDAGPAAESMIAKILRDLANPADAITSQLHPEVRAEYGIPRKGGYRLVTLSGEAVSTQQQADLFKIDPRRFVLRCEKYGVPQARHRVIVVGIRADLDGEITPLNAAQQAVSARQVLAASPPLRSGLSKMNSEAGSWVKAVREETEKRISNPDRTLALKTWVQRISAEARHFSQGGPWIAQIPKSIGRGSALQAWLADPQLKGFIQHEARGHMSSDLARYLFCAAFASAKGYSPKLEDWPPGPLRPAHRNVQQRNGRLEAEGFSDRFKVQGVADNPSSTITSHIAKDGHYYIHFDPLQCRSITVREAARLQTFKDNYYFCGNRTQQYHQVGNAVPPYLAKQIADRIGEFIVRSLLKKPTKASN